MLSEPRFKGFRSHPRLEGTHATLSPSSPAWLRYTPERLIERLTTAQAAALGTELHEMAAKNIKLGAKLHPEGRYPVLAAHVNDAIDLELVPEQQLVYSLNCYGTADAIGFKERDMYLNVHDLKTGVSKPDLDQLYIYAAVFCLEYEFLPYEINGELRFYQEGKGVDIYEIDHNYLATVYSTIRNSDDLIEEHYAQKRLGGLI